MLSKLKDAVCFPLTLHTALNEIQNQMSNVISRNVTLDMLDLTVTPCLLRGVITAFLSVHAAFDIERCDLNIKENSSSHHTDLFGEERLIIRRGQRFTIVLHVKPDGGKFRLDDTSFSLIAETGKPLLDCNQLHLDMIFAFTTPSTCVLFWI